MAYSSSAFGAPQNDNSQASRQDRKLPVGYPIDVASIDDYVAKIEANGGALVRPKMAIPDVGYAAVCNDTEGNPIGLFQVDANAA